MDRYGVPPVAAVRSPANQLPANRLNSRMWLSPELLNTTVLIPSARTYAVGLPVAAGAPVRPDKSAALQLNVPTARLISRMWLSLVLR